LRNESRRWGAPRPATILAHHDLPSSGYQDTSSLLFPKGNYRGFVRLAPTGSDFNVWSITNYQVFDNTPHQH